MRRTRRFANMGLALAGLLVALLTVACSSAARGDYLAVGDPAPSFTLPDATGQQVALQEYTGRKPVLLYFHMGYG